MASHKTVYYLDENNIQFLESEQARRALRSPSAALREILSEAQNQPYDELEELNLLGDILAESTASARRALAQAFNDLEETKRQLDAAK
jgi:hypothetical protein